MSGAGPGGQGEVEKGQRRRRGRGQLRGHNPAPLAGAPKLDDLG